MHYEDITKRVADAQLLFASADDDKYGSFMAGRLHAADIVFRAVEKRINILTASTNAPIFFVDRCGAIKAPILTPYVDGFLLPEEQYP